MYRGGLVLWTFLFLSFINVKAQNASNKGKEFWVAYNGHIDQLTSKMYLYVTSDVNTSVNVSIGGTNINGSPFSIVANQVQAIPIDARDAYIGSSDAIYADKAIHLTADQPVVVYAHIFKAARSGATLVLPAKVLGREYITAAYTQNTPPGNNQGPAYSQFTIIAVEDNTVVKITPKARDITGSRAAGAAFLINLQKGEIYQYQSETDLSGSHIISVADIEGVCKPIAVFSGSSWVGFCNENRTSTTGGDNLYQQLYPITAWGKEFITAPFIHKPYDVFRVYFSKDNTRLTINGITEPGIFNKGTFKEFSSAGANSIKGSEPISVVQYQISQDCDSRNDGYRNEQAPYPGDPEMTVLNPVEQTLSKITVYSARRNQTNPPTNITQHYINIIIKDEFKASFTINGLPPLSTFQSINNTGYSYLQEDVTAKSVAEPTHTLMADGGFSAIAYGYGSVESYGYLAGADAKNLYENLQLFDANTELVKSDVCVGQEAIFRLILPFKPFKLTWTVDGVEEEAINDPAYDFTEVVNGVSVYRFDYARKLQFNEPKVHQIKATVINPNPSGCDPKQEIITDFEAFALPVSKFSSNKMQTCVGTAITFREESIPNGKNIVKWHWDFGDGETEVRRSAEPFDYIYTNPGNYQVTLMVETESGCLSPATTPLTIHINKLPEARFKFTTPSCETREISFTDESIAIEGTIRKWQWNFGDADNESHTSNVSTDQHPVHTYSNPGIYRVTLSVETDNGCGAVLEKDVIITELPVSDFETPDACISDAVVKFTNTSINRITGLQYLWDFADPVSGIKNTSTDEHGEHKYTVAGNYNVTLTVITPEGCRVSTTKTFRVNGSTPVALFEVMNAGSLCSNKEILVKDKSTIGSSDQITRVEWYIDGELVVEKRHPLPNDIYTLNLPAFTSPVSKNMKLKLVAYSGGTDGPCYHSVERGIVVLAAPLVQFDGQPPVCLNEGKIQIETQVSGDVEGIGVFSGNGITSSGLFDPKHAGVGTWEITYTYTGDNGCVDIKRQSIVVQPTPKVTLATDLYVFVDGTIQVNATASEQDLKFKWSPSIGLNRDDILNPIITAVEDKVYTLTVTSQLNCDETVFVRLHALREIVPPNAFSPNGDGVNDVWKLNYLESYVNATVDIFNRYGEKVFFSQGYSIPFDGNYKGEPLPVGTYYYIINPGNGKKAITGSLTLIR